MPKEIKEKHPLRLIRWANDGYPPIDLSNEFSALIELIMGYRELEEENKALKEKNNQLVDALDKADNLLGIIEIMNPDAYAPEIHLEIKEALKNNIT